jgi:hypothetical protein
MGNEAAYRANIQYWQSVAARYQRERDAALVEAELVRKILLAETGKAYDGNDWLREVARTQTRNTVWHRIKSFFS